MSKTIVPRCDNKSPNVPVPAGLDKARIRTYCNTFSQPAINFLAQLCIAHVAPGRAAISCAGGALLGEAFERSTNEVAAGVPRETLMMRTRTLSVGSYSDSENDNFHDSMIHSKEWRARRGFVE